MLIIMKPNSTPQQIEGVVNTVKSHGLTPHITHGVETTIIAAVGEFHTPTLDPFEVLEELRALNEFRNLSNLARVRCIPKIPFFQLTDLMLEVMISF